MNKHPMRAFFVGWTAVLLTHVAFARNCDLVDMPIAGNTGRIGDVTVAFGDADNPRSPTAWQGPLRISMGSGPACTASDAVSIVEKPVLLGQDVLYVSTYSGSTNRVYAIDVKTCRTLWQGPAFTGSVDHRGALLTTGSHHIRLTVECRPPGVAR